MKNQDQKLTLTFNLTKRTYQRFQPGFNLRPDFILTSRNIEDKSEGERMFLIADAKYKTKPGPEDFERMLAYMLSYGWNKPQEIANGLFLFIGSNNIPNGTIRGPRERKNPNARLYSICLRPDPMSQEIAEEKLVKLLDTL